MDIDPVKSIKIRMAYPRLFAQNYKAKTKTLPLPCRSACTDYARQLQVSTISPYTHNLIQIFMRPEWWHCLQRSMNKNEWNNLSLALRVYIANSISLSFLILQLVKLSIPLSTYCALQRRWSKENDDKEEDEEEAVQLTRKVLKVLRRDFVFILCDKRCLCLKINRHFCADLRFISRYCTADTALHILFSLREYWRSSSSSSFTKIFILNRHTKYMNKIPVQDIGTFLASGSWIGMKRVSFHIRHLLHTHTHTHK